MKKEKILNIGAAIIGISVLLGGTYVAAEAMSKYQKEKKMIASKICIERIKANSPTLPSNCKIINTSVRG